MNVLKKSIVLGGCVAALVLGAANQAMAQGGGGGRGNFDPAQFRQDRMDQYHEQLEVTNDTEWKAIEPLVGKVFDAQREVAAMRFGGGMGGRNRRNNNNGDNNNGDQPQRQRRNPFGEPSAAMTALREAIAAKAPASELKTKLAAVRAETKDKEAKLDAAQEELRGVLSSRQEAIAVANGLLK